MAQPIAVFEKGKIDFQAKEWDKQREVRCPLKEAFMQLRLVLCNAAVRAGDHLKTQIGIR